MDEKRSKKEYDDSWDDIGTEDERLLGLFKGRKEPTPRITWEMYQKGLGFNTQINLDDTVRVNENFFIGKQWEGVSSNNLPTPQINILKRTGMFTIATTVSDNVKVTASPLANTVGTTGYKDLIRYVNDEFEAIFERNKIPSLVREFARDAAVDGDGCIYTYWDADAETGQKINNTEIKGQIRCETIDNTRVFFGNPSDVHVESQPWIIIAKRIPERNARLMAKNNGSADWRNITAAPEDSNVVDEVKWNDDLVTILHIFWKDDETEEVWTYCCAEKAEIEEAKSLGIKHYPIVWLCWDTIKDCYHGQAMMTGLIPNQIAINKTHALTEVSMMNMAFPSKIYDKTRIGKITNQVGAAYGVNGSVDNAMKVVEGANISPQVFQYIQSLIDQTQSSLGATDVALGDTRPDNTSAIIALQRAASTPSELTKQNIYSAIEDLARIFLDFMGEFYGTRYVDRPINDQERQLAMIAQQVNPDQEIPEEVPEEFDFSQIKEHPVIIKVDVGASTYYSEIASIQTLENLLMQNQITVVQFLERLPDDYVPQRMALISELKNQQAQMAAAAPTPAPGGDMGGEMPVAQTQEMMDIPTGSGNGELQRTIMASGDTKGLV